MRFRYGFASLIVALACVLGSARADASYFNTDLAAFWRVSVCWEPLEPGVSVSELSKKQEWVRRAVESNWARYSPIGFTGWANCTSNDTFVRIRVTSSGPSDSVSAMWEPNVAHGMVLNLNQSQYAIERAAVTNFGHILGFYHEEERLDFVAPTGTTDRNANGVPDKNEPSICGFRDGTGQFWDPKFQPMIELGKYDHQSVMSTCSGKNVLSPGDIAGLMREYDAVQDDIVSPTNGYMLRKKNEFAVTRLVNIGNNEGVAGEKWKFWTANATNFLIKNDAWNACLTVATGSSYPSLGECTGTAVGTKSEWKIEKVSVRGWGGLCLEAYKPLGITYTYVRLAKCNGSTAQQWSWDPDGQLRYGALSSTQCLTRSGSSAMVKTCTDPTNQVFKFDARKIYVGTKCLDVQGPTDADYQSGIGLPEAGNTVQFFDCLTDQENQKWFLNGFIKHASTGKCVYRVSDNADASPQMSTCPTSPTATDAIKSQWDISF